MNQNRLSIEENNRLLIMIMIVIGVLGLNEKKPRADGNGYITVADTVMAGHSTTRESTE